MMAATANIIKRRSFKLGKIDLTGKKFGRLTAMSEIGKKHKQVYWLCICECGNKTEVSTHNLRQGSVKSCGCSRNGINKKGKKGRYFIPEVEDAKK
jgi:hypothetical protein